MGSSSNQMDGLEGGPVACQTVRWGGGERAGEMQGQELGQNQGQEPAIHFYT